MIAPGKKKYTNGIETHYYFDDEVPAGYFHSEQSIRCNKVSVCKRCGKEFTKNKPAQQFCIDCYNFNHREKTCPVCGKKFRIKYQDNQCCSKSCAKKLQGNFRNPDILNKIAITNLERYGVENPWNNAAVQQKCSQNNDRSGQKEWIKNKTEKHHSTPEYIEKQRIKNLKSKSKAISRHELILLDRLSQTFEVKPQYTFEGCKLRNKLRFDLFIPRQSPNVNGCQIEVPDILIEYDGEQHFKPIRFNSISDTQMYKNFISTQVKDWVKEKFSLDNNIPLVRINPSAATNYDEIYRNGYIVNTALVDRIKVFDINESDFVNYKKPTFTVYSGISCTFKCDKENGSQYCQNFHLCKSPIIDISIDNLIQRFDNQQLSESVTFQGLEPLDNLKQLLWFIYKFRAAHNNEIIIWTGYTEDECSDLIYLFSNMLKQYKNIIIKFGRYRPDQQSHYDEILGVNLANDEQYAIKIS